MRVNVSGFGGSQVALGSLRGKTAMAAKGKRNLAGRTRRHFPRASWFLSPRF
jgi:hypothetical protein